MLYRIREGKYDLPIARLGQPVSGVYEAILMTLDGGLDIVELVTEGMIQSESSEVKELALRNPEDYRPSIEDVRKKFLPRNGSN